MPIIDIELVEPAGTLSEAGLAQALADALGEAFGVAPGKIWTRIRSLPAANYAENHLSAPNPVFVTVLASAPPDGEELRKRIAQTTEIVARLTRRPADNVHVLFEPAAKGRIAFGGRLVE